MGFKETQFSMYVVAAEAVPGLLRTGAFMMDLLHMRKEQCKQLLGELTGNEIDTSEVDGLRRELDRVFANAGLHFESLTGIGDKLIQYAHEFLLFGTIKWPENPTRYEGEEAIKLLSRMTGYLEALRDSDSTMLAHWEFLVDQQNTEEGKAKGEL